MGALPGRFAVGLAKHAGIGGALGAGGSLFKNALDDEGDRFDFKDTIGDAGQGALLGGLFGGVGGGLLGASKKSILRKMGTGSKGIGMLGALMQDYEPADPSPEAGVGAPGIGGALRAGNASGGLLGASADLSGGLGSIGNPPAGPIMTLADYMDNPRLNSQVDGLLAQELNPLNRQVGQIKREKDADLQSNEALGQDLQNQMAQIARDNASQTRSIQNNADAHAQRAAEETDKAAAAAELGLTANDSVRENLAENQATLDSELADRRMADAELLERLGVSTSQALSEIAAAEVQQTGQNSIKIRTDANDAITETRGQMADVRAKRPTLLGQLAQGAFDSSIQKHQSNLGTFQAKLQMAKDRAEAAKNQKMLELEMQTAQAGPEGFKPEHYLKGSGMKIADPITGDPMDVPFFATLPYEALPPGLIDQQTWMKWQQMIGAAEEAQ